MLLPLSLLLPLVPFAQAKVLPGGVGRVPALGWNSWNAYGCGIDEEKFLSAATNMVSKGFKAAGYEYVNIDDCWSNNTSGRDPKTHYIIPNYQKFPEGIDGLAKKIHAMGLKIGIYSSAGTGTCAGYPASLGYEDIDAHAFASWGIDFLKYDNCGVPANWSDTCNSCTIDHPWTTPGPFINGTCVNQNGVCPKGYDYKKSNTFKRYQRMSEALDKVNRTILYNLCEWGLAEVWTWGAEVASAWRTTDDIRAEWSDIAQIINQNSFITNYAGFYGHNDPDMLEVGNGDLTPAETRSHFAMWALLKAPLIIGTDLAVLSEENVKILLNKRLLAFNQDPTISHAAAPYKWGTNPDWTWNSTNPAEYWAGISQKGMTVALLNTLDTNNRTMRINYSEIPGLQKQNAEYELVNVWTGESKGCHRHGFDVQVDSHDIAVFNLFDGCGCTIDRPAWINHFHGNE